MLSVTESAWHFDAMELLPAEWADGNTDAYIFNPSICKIANGYAAVYRVVTPGTELRRLATCTLDSELNLVPGSVSPLSDLIEFAATADLSDRALTWHADPRFFVLQGEIYITWNTGAGISRNHQFMMKMDASGTRPSGPAREVLTTKNRKNIEKNWIFFEVGKSVYCIYSANPHEILVVDLSDPDYVVCEAAYSTASGTEYETLYGVIRGGAQPVQIGDSFLCIAHSSYKMADTLRYYACTAYEFSATPPFRMTRCATVPFTLPHLGSATTKFELAKLNRNVGSVVYPCGAVREGDHVLISYGVNDERAAVAKVSLATLSDLLKPVDLASAQTISPVAMRAIDGAPITRVVPRLFWWDAFDKSFDGKFGARKFKIGNFGDIASRDIVERITKFPTKNSNSQSPKLLAIGSIMHNARNGDIIWGSGVKGTHKQLHESVRHLDVRAVRGPLSADVLRSQNIDVSKLRYVFDPGCLVKHLYEKEIAAFDTSRNAERGKIRIVPHYRDDIFFRRLYVDHAPSFISVDENPLGMVEKLLGAEAVFSSSLHGIIFAESLGIPAYWLTPHGGEDVFKYFDYYYGTGRYNVKSYDSLVDAFRAPQCQMPQFDAQAYIDTFPTDRLAELSTYGLEMSSDHSFASMSLDEIRNVVELSWDDVRHNYEGLIVLRSRLDLRIPVRALGEGEGFLRLSLGRTKGSRPYPVRVKIEIEGRHLVTLEWESGIEDDQSCEFHVPKNMAHRLLQLTIIPENVSKPTAILRRLSLSPAATVTDPYIPDLVERTLRREARAKSVASQFSDAGNEWLVAPAGLLPSSNLYYDNGDATFVIEDQATLHVPNEIMRDVRLIFLAGRGKSLPPALKSAFCVAKGRHYPLETHFDPTRNYWTAKCEFTGFAIPEPGETSLRFEFPRAQLQPTDSVSRSSVRPRKIAFAKIDK